MKLQIQVKKYLKIVILTAGKGAYGLVVAARDRSKDENEGLIAIKKIEKAFDHRIFTKRTLRELKIMRLCDHENVKILF